MSDVPDQVIALSAGVEFDHRWQHAYQRVRAEFFEMPGMRLSAQQVERLCGVPNAVCKIVLDDLVTANFLYVGSDGTYGRRVGVF
jgi:hypothetical protein